MLRDINYPRLYENLQLSVTGSLIREPKVFTRSWTKDERTINLWQQHIYAIKSRSSGRKGGRAETRQRLIGNPNGNDIIIFIPEWPVADGSVLM